MNDRKTSLADFRPDDPEWYLGDPHRAYRILRRESPVHWYEPDQFWFLTRHADVHAVSKDPKTFCSTRGFRIKDENRSETSRPALAGIPPSLLAMDPPVHTRYRRLVSAFFTPRAVRSLEERIREIARESLEAIEPGEVLDFVEVVSSPLPVLVIAEILGVPTSEQAQFRAWSDDLIASNEGNHEAIARVGEFFAYMVGQGLERRAAPRDDLLSLVATGKPEGHLLEEPELGSFGISLLGAGNETTRNLVSGAAEALMAHPQQRAQLASDSGLIPAAVEEMVRYVTPIKAFARTATLDTEIRGQRIAAGDFVVICYAAANRDEEIFGDTSEAFDVHRKDAASHLGFGVGQHVCLGAHLARLEARVLFEELLRRFPRFELAGEPQRLRSTMINGIEHMPVVFYEA